MATIKVWLGHLGAYNGGNLIGNWYTLPMDEDEMNEAFEEIQEEAAGVGEYGEEIDIFDYETDVNGLYHELSGMSLRQMNELAETLDGLQSYQLKELETVLQAVDSFEEAVEIIEQGRHLILTGVANKSELSERHIEEFNTFEIPEHLERYFDHEKHGMDLVHNGWTILHGEKIAVYIGD